MGLKFNMEMSKPVAWLKKMSPAACP